MASASEPELNRLLSAAESAYKAAHDGDNAEEGRAVGALRVLQATAVTVDLLQSTDAGKRVKRLCKASSKNVAEAAAAVIEVWKESVKKQKMRCATPVGMGSQPDSASDPSTSEPAAASVSRNGSAVLPSKRETVVSQVSASAGSKSDILAVKPLANLPPPDLKPSRTGDETRDKIRELLAQALHAGICEAAPDAPEAYADPCALAVELEDAMLLQNGGVNAKYKAKYRSLAFNLKDPNNPDLRARVLRGELPGSKLVNLSAEQLASDSRRQENDKIRDDMKKECERGQSSAASTDMFQCGRCKQRKCTYYQMQTRSADEPMTTFVTCTVCGKRWKFC